MAKKPSKNRQRLLDWAVFNDVKLTLLEGPEFDVAILGVVTGKDIAPKVLYSTAKVMAVLKNEAIKGGMHEDQAVEAAMEWFSVNTSDAYVGESTPCFLEDLWE